MQGCVPFLLCLHGFDESSSWTQRLFQLNSVLSSFASHIKHAKRPSKTHDPEPRRETLRAVNFSRSISRNLDELFFFFSSQTGKRWLRGVGIYQKLSAAQLKRSFDSNPREEGGGGEDRDERNRLIRETLQQPCS